MATVAVAKGVVQAHGKEKASSERLPSLRKGMKVAIVSHTPWFGKRYDVFGTVEVTPRTVRSGAVMVRVRVEEGVVEDKRGTRHVVGQSLWIPWSPSYVTARAVG